MSTTLLNMRERVRARADMKNSSFVEDDELTQYINSSYQELYDLLVASFEDYYTATPLSINITSGNSFDLPVDFYKLRGVDGKLDNNNFFTLQPFNFAERNINRQGVGIINSNIWYTQYRIVGNKILITPEDNATGNYRLWYIPRCPILVSDIDTLDGINGWEEYVVVDAARKCLAKEESDTSGLVQDKEMLRKRIEAMAARRDAGMPKTITDVFRIDINSNRRLF
jgi:hypothetical protein